MTPKIFNLLKNNKKKNIGLFFGSFNPMTIAHLWVGQICLEEDIDFHEIWYVLSPQNPFKKNSIFYATPYERKNIIKKSLKSFGNKKMKYCGIELNMPQPSYTYDTLIALKKKYPNYNFKIICGTDVFNKIRSWKYGELIYKNYNFTVCNRNNESLENDLKQNDCIVNDLDINISSTMVRKRREESKSIKFLVSPNVENYVKKVFP